MREQSTSQGAGSSPVHPILLLKVPRSLPVWVRFLGPLRQLGTHKQGDQPLVCWGDDDCDPKRHKLPYRSKWYAPAQQWIADKQVWRRTVIEVTEALERTLRGKKLRGQVWCLFRKPKSLLPKQIHGEQEESLPDGSLPPTFNVDPVLYRVYNETSLPEPASNLLNERPMTEDQAGPGPRRLAPQARDPEPEEEPEPSAQEDQRPQLGRIFRGIGEEPANGNGNGKNGKGAH